MSKISVIINTLNEEENISRALSSIQKIADEIVVCDMYSDDKTVEIAKKFGAKIYHHKRTNFVEPARNYALSKATGDWLFILDADEEMPASLGVELEKIAESEGADYVLIPRKNIIFGKWMQHSRWWPDYNIRFFKKGAVSWGEIIHSVPETKGTRLEVSAEENLAIVHYHYTSVEQYLERMNRYTTEHARLLIKDGYHFDWGDLIKKPANEFLSRYFFGQGYKDGLHGIALAGLQSFSELALYLKVWQAKDFKEEKLEIKEVIHKMKKSGSDFNYWQADTLLKEGGGLTQRIKRKLRLP